MKIIKRRAQMRIWEALITCGFIILAYRFLSISSTSISAQNNYDINTMSNNLLNTLENQDLLIGIINDEDNWKGQIQQIISSTIPPGFYYNLTFTSLISNSTIGSVTNIKNVSVYTAQNTATTYGVFSFSYPLYMKKNVLIDVILVMDRSGSMSWKIPGDPQPKIYYTKLAAKNFIDKLDVFQDQAALTSFATDSKLDIGLTNNYNLVKNKIDALVADGWTNLMGGINKANLEFQNYGRDDSVKVMIILTDGKANWWDGKSPYSSEDEIRGAQYALEKAEIAKNMGIKIFTIGLGAPDYLDEELLEAIQTNGYYKAPSAQQLETIYQSIAEQILTDVEYEMVLIQVTLMKPLEGV